MIYKINRNFLSRLKIKNSTKANIAIRIKIFDIRRGIDEVSKCRRVTIEIAIIIAKRGTNIPFIYIKRKASCSIKLKYTNGKIKNFTNI